MQAINFTLEHFDFLKTPTTTSTLISHAVPPLFSANWAKWGYKTIGDFRIGDRWVDEEDLLLPENATMNVRNQLIAHYRRIRVFFQALYTERDVNRRNTHEIVLKFKYFGGTTLTLNKSNRRKLQNLIMAEYFQRTSDKCLSNHWTENDTNWSSFFNCCTSGSMAEISWRFAKNRLADPTYLLKANIRVTENCQPKKFGALLSHGQVTSGKVEDYH
ncbi:uncharacterized protein LOC116163558 [Photinus pyralis]|uniref:uncharacterized protein LOC116163558 n=1 Tax=Photinus pyralis TaxID=7054 RepID=UPI0012676F0D|nr:uncharacterized protein LOC116163558 [Photinus pyralis]